jgi:hypothetical protein
MVIDLPSIAPWQKERAVSPPNLFSKYDSALQFEVWMIYATHASAGNTPKLGARAGALTVPCSIDPQDGTNRPWQAVVHKKFFVFDVVRICEHPSH